jgi:hypothetical protein
VTRSGLAGALLLVALLIDPMAMPAQAATPVRVATSVTPSPTRFGDVVQATLVVRASGAATVEQGFSPFSVLAASSTSSTTGGVVTTTWRFALQCLQAQCAPGPGVRSVRLTPSRVRVGPQSALARFPVVRVVPRVTARQVSRPNSSFLHPTTLPAPTYRVSPTTARAVLLAAAVVLVLAALVLLRPVVLPARPRAAEPEPEPLGRALALVRASLTRSAPDRRRALGLLSRTLRRRHEAATGQAAADLAWSEPEPDPQRMEELADRIDVDRIEGIR